MNILELKSIKDYLYTSIGGRDFLIDTGSPLSIGDVARISFGGREFPLVPAVLDLDAKALSDFIGHETAGLIGTDILNRFDLLFDLPNGTLSILEEKPDLIGDTLPLEYILGVPVVRAKIEGDEQRLVFDTGAKINYVKERLIGNLPPHSVIRDFYMGVGEFDVPIHLADVELGSRSHRFESGGLPGFLETGITRIGADGILGNAIFNDHVVGYFPKSDSLLVAA